MKKWLWILLALYVIQQTGILRKANPTQAGTPSQSY